MSQTNDAVQGEWYRAQPARVALQLISFAKETGSNLSNRRSEGRIRPSFLRHEMRRFRYIAPLGRRMRLSQNAYYLPECSRALFNMLADA